MLEFKKELITPSRAKELLEANINNRRVRAKVVNRYAQDMLAGRWKQDTGETMKISKSGIVLDGQHRLYGIVKANIPIFFHIAYGIDDSVSDVLDTGSGRSASDVFRLNRITNESSMPSIIQMYHLLKNNNFACKQKDMRLTNAQLLQKYNEHEILWQDICKKSHNWYLSFAKILPKSFIGGFYSVFKEIDLELAEQFMNELCTVINVSNETMLLLRNKLIQDKMSQRKISPTLKTIFMIKAWNCFVKGIVLKKLAFDSERESYPKILGKKISEQKLLL
jgi:hypothetical protein